MTSHLTRRQMYDLVWTRPLPQVAAHLGLDEWAVALICERHRVPLPKPVFWRDKAAGRKAKQAIFTSTADRSLELIAFDPARPVEPLPEQEIKPTLIVEPAAPKRPAAARTPVEPVEWRAVEKPHPLLTAAAKALRSAKPDQHGVVEIGGEHIPAMSLAQASVERAIFILDDLIRRLTAEGISCTLSRQQFTLARGQDDVGFKFSEKIAKVPHEPTLPEFQAEARRLRNGGTNYDWHWNKAYPEFDFVPTGTLRLSVTTWGGMGRRRNWHDGKRASLESQVANIAAAMDDWIDGERQRRLERERQSRIWRRADENRRLAEARRKREDERDALIAEIVQLQVKARDLRAWIDWAAPIEDAETKRMLEWARGHLASIERAVNPAAFSDWLREKKLFPEIEPYAPLPDDPDVEPGPL